MPVGIPDIFKGLPEPPISKIVEAIKNYKPKQPLPHLERFGLSPFYQTPPLQDVTFGDFFKPIKGNIDIVADDCNFGYEIGIDLGIVNAPPRQVVWRNPYCQPPPIPPPHDDSQKTHQPPPINLCGEQQLTIGIMSDSYRYFKDKNYDYWEETRTKANITKIIYPATDCIAYIEIATEYFYNCSKAYAELTRHNFTSPISRKEIRKGKLFDSTGIPNRIHDIVHGGAFFAQVFIGFDNIDPNYLAIYANGIDYDQSINIGDPSEEYKKGFDNYKIYSTCGNFPEPPPPPPPPPKMDCCPGQQNNDALLKLILKRIGTLPVDVQTSYLTKNGVQPEQTKSIESLTDFIAWFAERHDETIGEFEINIEVKDGDKSHTVRLPNLAEAIAEMFTMLIHSNINNELTLNIVNRTLAEAGQIKQSEFKTHSALTALIDYAGFHTEMKVEQMPLSFTPGEKSFNGVLVESSQDVAVMQYTEKDTLATAMHTLLQAAAIIRGVHYAKTPGDQSAIAKKLKENLTTLLGENGNLSDQVKTFIKGLPENKIYSY